MTCDEFWELAKGSVLEISRGQRAAILRHDTECKSCHDKVTKKIRVTPLPPVETQVAIIKMMDEDEKDREYLAAKGKRV